MMTTTFLPSLLSVVCGSSASAAPRSGRTSSRLCSISTAFTPDITATATHMDTPMILTGFFANFQSTTNTIATAATAARLIKISCVVGAGVPSNCNSGDKLPKSMPKNR